MSKNNIIITLLLISALARAQYPVIPDSIKEREARQSSEILLKSDEAWEKALPIVMEQDKEGRPYRPWASKPTDLIKADIPAFPGAEGGGAFTPGGRGGQVITVRNLNDSGPGSLREACEQGGARIIVFNIAGVINLKSPITVRAPYITIAGQTAPGDGICISGASFLIDTHDVIIRHVRFRRASQDVAFRDDALGGNAVGNIMIDHCSGSWGLDEVMSLYRHVYNRNEDGSGGEKLPTVNITMQNCIFAEGLDTYNHAFGATIGGHNSMFARNLFASNVARNPSVGMDGDFNFVNNVIYNWWNRSIDGGDDNSYYTIINNYFKPGPITPKDKPISHRILKPESSRDKNKPNSFGKAYVKGNIVEGNKKVTKNNWAGGVQVYSLPDAGEFTDQIRVNKPYPNMPHVTITSAKKAFKHVMENVGATLPKRDSVDERIIKTVITGKAIYSDDAPEYTPDYIRKRLPADSYKKGIIYDIRQVGGMPEYKGQPYLDSDGDGMPDEWEIKNGLDPFNPDDALLDCNGDGYTNIEKYINGIDTKKKVDWTKPKNNKDTLAKKKSLL